MFRVQKEIHQNEMVLGQVVKTEASVPGRAAVWPWLSRSVAIIVCLGVPASAIAQPWHPEITGNGQTINLTGPLRSFVAGALPPWSLRVVGTDNTIRFNDGTFDSVFNAIGGPVLASPLLDIRSPSGTTTLNIGPNTVVSSGSLGVRIYALGDGSLTVNNAGRLGTFDFTLHDDPITFLPSPTAQAVLVIDNAGFIGGENMSFLPNGSGRGVFTVDIANRAGATIEMYNSISTSTSGRVRVVNDGTLRAYSDAILYTYGETNLVNRGTIESPATWSSSGSSTLNLGRGPALYAFPDLPDNTSVPISVVNEATGRITTPLGAVYIAANRIIPAYSPPAGRGVFIQNDGLMAGTSPDFNRADWGAIYTTLGGRIVNAGTITAVSYSAIANAANEIIIGGGPRFALPLVVENTGTIRSANYHAIWSEESLTVTNAGTISAPDDVILIPATRTGSNVALTLINRAGGVIEAASRDNVAINADTPGVSIVDNAGRITGWVTLGDGDDTVILRPGGRFEGLVNGWTGDNLLRIGTGAGERRDITGSAAGDQPFYNFRTIRIEGAGVVAVGAAPPGSPGWAALEAQDFNSPVGALIPGGRIEVASGELNLATGDSAIRAERVVVERGARLSGIGTVYTGAAPGTGLEVAGMIMPGNSIGTLTISGNLTLAGSHEAEYRPPPLGLTRGRNTLEGTAATPAEQDADLLLVSGPARVAAASLVPIRRGTAAAMNAALAASPSGELRWLVLRAQGGLGGTRYAALSNLAEVRVEYPDNGTDVELVLQQPISDGGVDLLLLRQPPPELQMRDRVLRQQAVSSASAAFVLGADCHRSDGLGAAMQIEGLCYVAQGRLLSGRIDASNAESPLLQPGLGGGMASVPGQGALGLRRADAAIGRVERVSDNVWGGYILGFGTGSFEPSGPNGGRSRTRYDALLAAALVRWASGPLELRGMASVSVQKVDARRPSSLAGGATTISADYLEKDVGFAGEARWWFGTRGAFALAPAIRLQQIFHWRDAYSERGDTADAFAADRSQTHSLLMTPGVTGEIGARFFDRPIVLEPSIGWQHALSAPSSVVEGSYRGAPGVHLRSTAAATERDSVIAGLAAVAEITAGTRFRLGYDAAFNHAHTLHALSARVSYSF